MSYLPSSVRPRMWLGNGSPLRKIQRNARTDAGLVLLHHGRRLPTANFVTPVSATVKAIFHRLEKAGRDSQAGVERKEAGSMVKDILKIRGSTRAEDINNHTISITAPIPTITDRMMRNR